MTTESESPVTTPPPGYIPPPIPTSFPGDVGYVFPGGLCPATDAALDADTAAPVDHVQAMVQALRAFRKNNEDTDLYREMEVLQSAEFRLEYMSYEARAGINAEIERSRT